MAITRFEDIESWQMGRDLCRRVFDLIQNSALGKDYSLKDQMERSSGSVMDNVAEGFDSGSNKEFVRFLRYSKRSCNELKSQLYRSLDRGYLSKSDFDEFYNLAEETRKKIGGFVKYLSQHLDRSEGRKTGNPKPETENT